MCILTRGEIIKWIKKGKLKIEPLNLDNIEGASIDLTLSDKWRVFKKGKKICDVREGTNYREFTEKVTKNSILLKPGEMILGMTEEKICFPPNLCGHLHGRSRFARLGMTVHVSATFVQPGVENHQVLEIVNLGKVPLRLHAGEKVCQLVFHKTVGKEKYTGKFASQNEP